MEDFTDICDDDLRKREEEVGRKSEQIAQRG